MVLGFCGVANFHRRNLRMVQAISQAEREAMLEAVTDDRQRAVFRQAPERWHKRSSGRGSPTWRSSLLFQGAAGRDSVSSLVEIRRTATSSANDPPLGGLDLGHQLVEGVAIRLRARPGFQTRCLSRSSPYRSLDPGPKTHIGQPVGVAEEAPLGRGAEKRPRWRAPSPLLNPNGGDGGVSREVTVSVSSRGGEMADVAQGKIVPVEYRPSPREWWRTHWVPLVRPGVPGP